VLRSGYAQGQLEGTLQVQRVAWGAEREAQLSGTESGEVLLAISGKGAQASAVSPTALAEARDGRRARGSPRGARSRR